MGLKNIGMILKKKSYSFSLKTLLHSSYHVGVFNFNCKNKLSTAFFLSSLLRSTLIISCDGQLQIAAICQEAGMHAVRKNRYVILPKDFEKGYRTNVKKPDTDFEFYK